MPSNPDEIPSERHARLVYFRQLKGISQREVGEALVPPKRREVIRDWEKGKNPTDEAIWSQIDLILGVPQEYSLAKGLEKKIETAKLSVESTAFDLVSSLEKDVDDLKRIYDEKISSLTGKISSLKEMIIKAESKTNGDFYLPRSIEKIVSPNTKDEAAKYIKLCLYSAAEVLEQIKKQNTATREMFRKMVTGNEGLEIGYIGTFLSSFFDSDEKLKRWGEGMSIDHISYPAVEAVQEGKKVTIEKAAHYVKAILFNTSKALEEFRKADAESRNLVRNKFDKAEIQYLTSFVNNFFGGEVSFTRWQEKFGDYKINYTRMGE